MSINAYRRCTAIVWTVAMILFTCVASAAQMKVDKKAFWFSNRIPEPGNNKQSPQRVKLGKILFFDPRLSGSNWISCATCHNPALGWSDGLPTAIGNGMGALPRSTPSTLATPSSLRIQILTSTTFFLCPIQSCLISGLTRKGSPVRLLSTSPAKLKWNVPSIHT